MEAGTHFNHPSQWHRITREVYQLAKINLRSVNFDAASLVVSGIATNLGECVDPISDAIFQNRNGCLQITHVIRTNSDC